MFANPRATSRAWYPAVRSRALRPGRVRTMVLPDRRIAVYRDARGAVHAIDARCPHLGADLSLGAVEDDGVRCAFHGWCFGPDGKCRDAPGRPIPSARRVRVYPCEERWGLVWVFNAPEPLFPLPDPGLDRGAWWAIPLPAQRITCHPHLVLANGLDITHYERLHRMTLTEAPRLTVGVHDVSVSLRGRPRSRVWQLISGTRHRDIVARFTTIGGSLAWAAVDAPVRFHVIFSGRPASNGDCLTRTIFLVRRGLNADAVRAFGLMATLLHDDRRILDSLDFRPDFDVADEPLRAFARVVNELGAW